MEVIRVIRVLEYIGPRDWVEHMLEKSFLQPGKPPDFITPPRSMREVARSDFEPVETTELTDEELIRRKYGPVFVDEVGEEEKKCCSSYMPRDNRGASICFNCGKHKSEHKGGEDEITEIMGDGSRY